MTVLSGQVTPGLSPVFIHGAQACKYSYCVIRGGVGLGPAIVSRYPGVPLCTLVYPALASRPLSARKKALATYCR